MQAMRASRVRAVKVTCNAVEPKKILMMGKRCQAAIASRCSVHMLAIVVISAGPLPVMTLD
jgi:hypothetical protein